MTGISGPGFRWITAPREMMCIRKSGALHRGKYLFIWVLDGVAGEELPAVAVVTGRGFRSAVKRNLARRRTRGVVLEARELLEPRRSYLIEGRPGAEEADYQFLVAEIEKALTRTGD
jgi:ribonuclease P protein component